MSKPKRVNRQVTIYLQPYVQGLLKQIEDSSNQPKSSIISSLIVETAQAMGLRAEDNEPKYLDG
jgi:hypothetical protein